jgi:DNA-binding PadR family transcriptional regulator
MPRRDDSPSRMEVLVLAALARMPMRGHELETELRYKHVRWWAKCEHGHLYAALARLERRGFVRRVGKRADRRSGPAYGITPAGRSRATAALAALGSSEDATYFDVDLFIACSVVLTRERTLRVLEQRRGRLREQLAEARRLREATAPHVPTAAHLIIDHRVEHLVREVAFIARALRVLGRKKKWEPFLGAERISDFVRRTRVHVE